MVGCGQELEHGLEPDSWVFRFKWDSDKNNYCQPDFSYPELLEHKHCQCGKLCDNFITVWHTSCLKKAGVLW